MVDSLFHTGEDYYDIEVAIRNGHLGYARECLRDLLRDNTDAEAWYLAALVALSPEQRIECLEHALLLNPAHERARRALDHTRQDTLTSMPPPSGLLARIERLFHRDMA